MDFQQQGSGLGRVGERLTSLIEFQSFLRRLQLHRGDPVFKAWVAQGFLLPFLPVESVDLFVQRIRKFQLLISRWLRLTAPF